MEAETLEALKGSIAKWEAIVAGTGKDDGPTNCPLCLLFHPDYREGGKGCDGCPVTNAGHRGCSNDEYAEFCEAEEEGRKERMSEAAKGELDFLKGLLPASDEVEPNA